MLRGIKLDEGSTAETVLNEVVRVLQKHLTRTIDMFRAWDKGPPAPWLQTLLLLRVHGRAPLYLALASPEVVAMAHLTTPFRPTLR